MADKSGISALTFSLKWLSGMIKQSEFCFLDFENCIFNIISVWKEEDNKHFIQPFLFFRDSER